MRIAVLSVMAILVLGTSCTKTVTKNNTVNQAFSAVYTITPDQWTQATDQTNGTTYYYATLSISELDNIIDNNGGVQTYLTFDDIKTVTDPTYEALPEVFNGVAYGSIHTTGKITIDLRDAYGTTDLKQAITQTVSIKVVLIDAAPLD